MLPLAIPICQLVFFMLEGAQGAMRGRNHLQPLLMARAQCCTLWKMKG